MSNEFIRVTATQYSQIVGSLRAGKKISAIKELRDSHRPNLSLKEAKWAVDRLQGEMSGDPGQHHGKKIICFPVILGLKLDYGAGPVEIDIENMQLRALTELQSIGVEACTHMLSLIDIFKAINEGKEVKVL